MKILDEEKINKLLINKVIVRSEVGYLCCNFWFDDGSHLLINAGGYEGTEATLYTRQ